MSNVESRKKIGFFICIAAAIAVASALLFCLLSPPVKKAESIKKEESKLSNLPFERLSLEYGKGEDVSFSATVKKEDLAELIPERGLVAEALFKFLPDKVELLCDAKLRFDEESGSVFASLSNVHLNGISIPSKLLSEMGEIELDFKRSLVYN